MSISGWWLALSAALLIVTVLQTYVLILVGMLALRVTIGDSSILDWVDLTIMALFGGALFTVLGLAISGWAKTEDVAAPVANIVTLPMLRIEPPPFSIMCGTNTWQAICVLPKLVLMMWSNSSRPRNWSAPHCSCFLRLRHL